MPLITITPEKARAMLQAFEQLSGSPSMEAFPAKGNQRPVYIIALGTKKLQQIGVLTQEDSDRLDSSMSEDIECYRADIEDMFGSLAKTGLNLRSAMAREGLTGRNFKGNNILAFDFSQLKMLASTPNPQAKVRDVNNSSAQHGFHVD